MPPKPAGRRATFKPTCPMCGSRSLERAIPPEMFGVRAEDAKSYGFIVKVQPGVRLSSARVCDDCGFVALFVDPAAFDATREKGRAGSRK